MTDKKSVDNLAQNDLAKRLKNAEEGRRAKALKANLRRRKAPSPDDDTP